ncbi:hypothetical protein ADH76_34055 [Enterocloster clostridioformis]|uniref:TRAP transporter large permease subunit n=1 Tax=Enterocloster clostridioformis TaxID=1531 RepID=UPI00080C6371|nr:TRAP transporter large permease subunit [Enterocloster clostridioformis]ANU45455.1 hypothetical protein A4V08_06065 [Lachnoclostridium sp. YL32]NDO32228.1 TRAP transporter large permease subunit [Enterocloster clostridioformis]OXE61515.1 hypothetical protein ADH76_34055 [Enterocloster clostridioformis]QQQ99781.1 TRAP transporter large permease subunit [Enterocloster clostridioformis]
MAIGVFFILLAVLLIAAMPVGGVFGIMSILPSIINPSFPYGAADVARSMFAGMNSFTLLAVPLFMVSGMIMAEGGLSERLFNFFAYFIGNKTAGFPCAVIVTCMFYAAISGSSPATVSAVGMATPPMGINLFVASGMTKIPMLKLAKATVPFLIAFIISLLVIVFVPQISMFLPGLAG